MDREFVWESQVFTLGSVTNTHWDSFPTSVQRFCHSHTLVKVFLPRNFIFLTCYVPVPSVSSGVVKQSRSLKQNLNDFFSRKYRNTGTKIDLHDGSGNHQKVCNTFFNFISILALYQKFYRQISAHKLCFLFRHIYSTSFECVTKVTHSNEMRL